MPLFAVSPQADGERYTDVLLSQQDLLNLEAKLTVADDRQRLVLLTNRNYQYSNLPNERFLELGTEALTLARQLKDMRAEAISLLNLGLIHIKIRSYTVAQEYYFQSLRLYEALASPADVAWLNIHIANIFRFGFSDYFTPLVYYSRAEKISREIGYPMALTRSLNNAGDLHMKLGDLEKAAQCFVEALAVSMQAELTPTLANIHSNLGEVYVLLEEFDKARQHLDQAHILFTKAANQFGPVQVKILLGRMYLRQKMSSEAMKQFEAAYQEVVDKERWLPPPDLLPRCLDYIGEAHLQAQNFSGAQNSFQQALTHQEAANDQHGQVISLRGLGQTTAAMGQSAAALKFLQRAQKICQRYTFLIELRDICQVMAEVQRSLGDGPGELASRRLLMETEQRLFSPSANTAARRILSMYESQSIQTEIQQMRQSSQRKTWISLFLFLAIMALIVLIALLKLNLKKIKIWANTTIIAKEIHIARHQTQLEILRIRLMELEKSEQENHKVSVSPLRDEQAQDLLRSLIELIDKQKPYLNPKVTLGSLSKQLGINRSYLSRVINDLLGKSFNEFINDCRIETAQKLLIERDFSQTSILDVAFDAGFNSKSVFNRVFKASTGFTPREYRKEILSESKNVDKRPHSSPS